MFQLQTDLRQDIKAASEQKIRNLITHAETSPELDAGIYPLLTKLRKQLDEHSGKKVYGYLPKSIKATVNEIVEILSAEPSIAKLYKEWSKINREKLSLYYENKDPTVPLVDNKEFRSTKNMVIKAVMELPPEVEQADSQKTLAIAGGIIGSLARLLVISTWPSGSACRSKSIPGYRRKSMRRSRFWGFARNGHRSLVIRHRKNTICQCKEAKIVGNCE